MDFLVPVAMLLVAAAAAASDARTGLIPNWLTLPPLFASVVLYFVLQGAGGLLFSLAGALACGLLPYFLFRTGSMGGGDVKLLAALGAIGGLQTGLEVQFMGIILAAVYAILVLAFKGRLGKMLLASLWVIQNLFLPAERRRQLPPAERMSLRLGVPIFLGTAVVLGGLV